MTRRLALVAAVLLVPIVPLALFGGRIDSLVEGWMQEHTSASATAAMAAGVLAADIILPVPSSVVSTIAGARLGVVLGTAVSWIGMTAGAAIGFGLTRRFGAPLAVRLSSAEEIARAQAHGERYGPLMLIVSRPLPLLAEASVIMAGLAGMSWRRFLWPVAASNLGIALVYSTLGHLARGHNALLPALLASIAVPLLAATILRAALRRQRG